MADVSSLVFHQGSFGIHRSVLPPIDMLTLAAEHKFLIRWHPRRTLQSLPGHSVQHAVAGQLASSK